MWKHNFIYTSVTTWVPIFYMFSKYKRIKIYTILSETTFIEGKLVKNIIRRLQILSIPLEKWLKMLITHFHLAKCIANLKSTDSKNKII